MAFKRFNRDLFTIVGLYFLDAANPVDTEIYRNKKGLLTFVFVKKIERRLLCHLKGNPDCGLWDRRR
jgi:hypothetical protein